MIEIELFDRDESDKPAQRKVVPGVPRIGEFVRVRCESAPYPGAAPVSHHMIKTVISVTWIPDSSGVVVEVSRDPELTEAVRPRVATAVTELADNEAPGARMQPDQRALVSAALEDLALWCVNDRVVPERVAGLDSALEEIDRRIRFGHVGPNLARLLKGSE